MFKARHLFQSIEPVEEEAMNYNECETEQSFKEFKDLKEKLKNRKRNLGEEGVLLYDLDAKKKERKRAKANSQLEKELKPGSIVKQNP